MCLVILRADCDGYACCVQFRVCLPCWEEGRAMVVAAGCLDGDSVLRCMWRVFFFFA